MKHSEFIHLRGAAAETVAQRGMSFSAFARMCIIDELAKDK